MDISDDMLMAYADGEFDPAEFAAERAAVEAATQADPALASRIDQHRALRRRLSGLYIDALQEPAPDQLVATIRAASLTSGTTAITDLNAVRAARRATPPATLRMQLSSNVWRAMAASLVVGVAAGYFAFTLRESGPMSLSDGQLLARNSLAEALSNQLASDATPTAVRVGLSFKAKSGAYCRTFVLQQGEAVGGLACRQGEVWRVQTVARVIAEPGRDGAYRQAGSTLPAAVRAAVEEQMAGDPLDADGEQQARQRGWQ